MHYLILFLLFFSTSAAAQFKIDDGIREPQSMVVSGDSVIDDESVDDDIEIPAELSEEEQKLLEDGTGDITVGKPINPETIPAPTPPVNPAVPAPNVKQVVKPYQQLKVRRAIADDRIDDAYVQEMLKDNTLFTPNQKK
jgi:hypothetical protein